MLIKKDIFFKKNHKDFSSLQNKINGTDLCFIKLNKQQKKLPEAWFNV